MYFGMLLGNIMLVANDSELSSHFVCSLFALSFILGIVVFLAVNQCFEVGSSTVTIDVEVVYS